MSVIFAGERAGYCGSVAMPKFVGYVGSCLHANDTRVGMTDEKEPLLGNKCQWWSK